MRCICSLYDVFGESTIKGDSSCVEVLTQERITTSTIETVVALPFREKVSTLHFFLHTTYGYAYISDTAVTDLEALDVLAHFDNFANGFMSWDELSNGTYMIRP